MAWPWRGRSVGAAPAPGSGGAPAPSGAAVGGRSVEIVVDGRRMRVPAQASLAAALAGAGLWRLRRSVTARPRGPVCGMGVCFECRVRVDGVSHRRACLEPVVEGMEVVTGEAEPGGREASGHA